MNTFCRPLGLFVALLLVLAFLLTGCGSEERACVPGASSSCACPDGRSGAQLCTSEGTFDVCHCVDDGNNDGDNDNDSDDDGDSDSAQFNLCGGIGDLKFEGATAALGDPCGPCEDGALTCKSPHELRCIHARETNACGGCDLLAQAPGEACGTCGDGIIECTEQGSVECLGASPPNACGGCTELAELPGDLCQHDGEPGVYQCQSRNETLCVAFGSNVCGGEVSLPAEPATSCGACNQGSWICDGADDVLCSEANAGQNACGGCGPLAGEPGTGCGTCGGSWVCDGTDAVRCDQELNPCGGCPLLEALPGTACGDSGFWRCDGADTVTCESDFSSNSCGGTAGLANQPGSSCGVCGDGTYICVSENATGCIGASMLNACGGCTALQAPPQTPCGSEAEWQCDGENAVKCVFLGENNLCGGTAPLSAQPGTSCGPCDDGEYTCISADITACVGASPLNACGGCVDLAAEPGNSCGDCGEWVCDGTNAVSCANEVDLLTDVNNCSACGNQCSGDAYCEEGQCYLFNACGGTDTLDHDPGDPCLQCGEWACDGSDDLVCAGATDTSTDPDNCGQCGNVCGTYELCDDGQCIVDKVVQVTTGLNHSCALRTSGTVICWGRGGAGQLGDGTTSDSFVPREVVGLDDAIFVEAGTEFTCALRANGHISCWGGNFSGQLGNGNDPSVSVPTEVAMLTNVSHLTVGAGHACAVQGGQAYCWGNNSQGQLGIGIWGTSFFTPHPVSNELPSTVEAISAGSRLQDAYTCAVADGTAYCWGDGSFGKLGRGSSFSSDVPVQVSDLSNAVDIATGDSHTCALDVDGDVFCWGRSQANGSTTSRNTPASVAGLSNPVVQISTGSSFTCALDDTGDVFCWGFGNSGRLGLGSTDHYHVPQLVSSLDDIVQISSRFNHACAVRANGQVLCWGQNMDGQLGDNQLPGDDFFFDRWVPTVVPTIAPFLTEAGACFTGEDHSGNGLVDCDDPDCRAGDLGTSTGLSLSSGSLFGLAGHYSTGPCDSDGPDVVYRWEAPLSQTFTIHGQGSGLEIVMYVREQSCTGTHLACDENSAPDGTPEITLDATAGQIYFIVVDSRGFTMTPSHYDYVLNIE